MSHLIQQRHLGLELELHFKMKIFFSILIIFLSFTINSYSQIAYIDMNFILNTSQVGKELNKYIKEISNKYFFCRGGNKMIAPTSGKG